MTLVSMSIGVSNHSGSSGREGKWCYNGVTVVLQ
jgi:hypothetical protein